MPTAQLRDRTIILIEGAEAEHFLQNLLTTDLDQLGPGEAKPGALLSPQGKILFDFLISRTGTNGFRLDCRAEQADDFIRRLTLYKLRAKVDISRPDEVNVFSAWNDEPEAAPAGADWFSDARFPAEAQVRRGYGASVAADASPAEWMALRIAYGIAEGGADYAPGDAFPHDVLLDETGGIGFRKGCYVGQEVVSRMQHRGTARRRVMLAAGEADLPESGTQVTTGGRAIGTLGSVAGRNGLAITRIDRVADALAAGQSIEACGVAIALSVPPWARYRLPGEDA